MLLVWIREAFGVNPRDADHRQWRSQRWGHGPPQLLVNVFSPIDLRCYVILVCKWSLDGATFILLWWLITRWRYCLSTAMITRWHCYIDAVMITRWRYCINAVMITRWQYCLSAVMITRWHHCIGVEMVTRWVHWTVNVFNNKKLQQKTLDWKTGWVPQKEKERERGREDAVFYEKGGYKPVRFCAHRSPAARDSFKRVHDLCKAGWCRPGAPPQTKILAMPWSQGPEVCLMTPEWRLTRFMSQIVANIRLSGI